MTSLENISKVLPVEKIYDDVASPAFKEIGEAARNAVKASRFLLAPIDYLAAQHERWLHFLKRINDKVPEENLIPAAPQLAGPVFEGLKYLEQDCILTELFINLLARAIDKDRVSEAHPAFPKVISQLSSDEAQIIFYLSKKERLLKQHSSYDISKNLFGARKVLANDFPLEKLLFPQNYFMYLDHLYSLNLAGIWQHGNQEATYEGSVQSGVNITSYASLTEFGWLFAKACMPEDIEEFHAAKWGG